MSPSPSAESAESPDSPSPSPLPAPRSPLFKAPTTSPSSLPRPSSPSPQQTHPLDPTPPPADEAAGPNWSTDAPSSPAASADEPSGTPSTGSGAKLSKAGLRTVVGTGFRQACRLLAAFAASEVEQAAGVWSPDPEDIADIAGPATNLIYRRLPDEAKGGDAIDLIGLGMALVAYVGKNLQWRAHVRAAQLQGEPTGIYAEAVDPGQAVSPGDFYERTRNPATVHPGETLGTAPTFPGGGF